MIAIADSDEAGHASERSAGRCDQGRTAGLVLLREKAKEMTEQHGLTRVLRNSPFHPAVSLSLDEDFPPGQVIFTASPESRLSSTSSPAIPESRVRPRVGQESARGPTLVGELVPSDEAWCGAWDRLPQRPHSVDRRRSSLERREGGGGHDRFLSEGKALVRIGNFNAGNSARRKSWHAQESSEPTGFGEG